MPAILSSALSLPPATRALTLTLVAGSLLFLLLRLSVTPHDLKSIFGATGDVSLVFPWLVLVPGKVYRAPWTLLTSAFVETNLIEASPASPLLPLLPMWAYHEAATWSTCRAAVALPPRNPH